MPTILALCAVTGGINLGTSVAELHELGLEPGSFSILSENRMEDIRSALEGRRGALPELRSGGSVANTADLIARAGVDCGVMGVGGDDVFGRRLVSNCKTVSLEFLSKLEAGAVTGYDFYLVDENGTRTIILTHGANSLLNPDRIDIDAIESSELVLIDGGALSFGPESEAALSYCMEKAEQAGVPFVLTLASARIVEDYRDFFRRFGPRAQFLAGNLEQAAVFLCLTRTATLDEVRTELAKGSFNAIVTLDSGGAFARFGEEEFLVPTELIDPVDSTGAGDAFLAAFLLGRRQGLSIPKALAVGNFISGQVIQYTGARLPLSVDVPELLAEAVRAAEP